MRDYARTLCALGVGAAVLAGCSSGPRPNAGPSRPAPSQAQMPEPPLGASAGMVVPVIGADGKRITPNRGLSSAGSIWHVRMALNVAALSCPQQGGAARISYNALLKTHKTALARANNTLDAEYRAAHGGKAAAVRDTLNTRVYNFFALPPVQPGFCARAIPIAAAFNARKSAELADYAPQALAALEQPYLDFYEAYVAYQQRLDAWRQTRAARTATR